MTKQSHAHTSYHTRTIEQSVMPSIHLNVNYKIVSAQRLTDCKMFATQLNGRIGSESTDVQ